MKEITAIHYLLSKLSAMAKCRLWYAATGFLHKHRVANKKHQSKRNGTLLSRRLQCIVIPTRRCGLTNTVNNDHMSSCRYINCKQRWYYSCFFFQLKCHDMTLTRC